MGIGAKYNKNNERCEELEKPWVSRYVTTEHMIQDSYKSSEKS